MRGLVLLLGLVLSLSAFSFPQGYQTKEIYEIKTDLDSNEAATAVRKVVQTDTITVSATLAESTTFNSDIVIPADSVITNSWILIEDTAITASDSNTLAVGCETATDVFTAADLSGESVNTFVTGTATGGLATWIQTDGCTLTYVTGTGTAGITAGEFTIGAEYFTKE